MRVKVVHAVSPRTAAVAVAVAAVLPVLGAPVTASAAARRAPAPAGRVARLVSSVTGIPAGRLTLRRGCPAPRPGRAACDAWGVALRSTGQLVHPRVPAVPAAGRSGPRALRSDATAASAVTAMATDPTLGTPAYLQSAYDLTALSQDAGAGQTVGIVDAGPYPAAAADLATYRARFGLPACTIQSGCLSIINENGGSTPPAALASNEDPSGWMDETALDLDAVSALCPNCHIVLVQSATTMFTDLDTGVSAAENAGATVVSLSWGATASSAQGSVPSGGVPVIAATGDNGYAGSGMAQYPASFANVTAAGGTTLTPAVNNRGFTETAWSLTSSGSGGGSGCSTAVTRPVWQSAAVTGCSGRAYADISADANPDTGLDVYNSTDNGWTLWGGTSLATPLIAAFEAVSDAQGTSTTAQWAYTDGTAGLLNDPASGTSGTCPSTMLVICNAGTGWDGPTGAGSISGAAVSGAPGVGATDSQQATATGPTAATLADGLWTNREATSYSYQYGPTTAYGNTTPAVSMAAGAQPQSVDRSLSGLTPGTTYHYRLTATDATGTTYGPDATFTTPAAPVSTTTTTTAQPPPSSPGAGTTSSSSGTTTTSGNGATGPTGVGLSELAAPAISGIAQVGWALHVSCGEWTEPWTQCAVQWQRADRRGEFRDIRDGRRHVLVLTRADRGRRVRAVVTVEAADGRLRGTAHSDATAPISDPAAERRAEPARRHSR